MFFSGESCHWMSKNFLRKTELRRIHAQSQIRPFFQHVGPKCNSFSAFHSTVPLKVPAAALAARATLAASPRLSVGGTDSPSLPFDCDCAPAGSIHRFA